MARVGTNRSRSTGRVAVKRHSVKSIKASLPSFSSYGKGVSAIRGNLGMKYPRIGGFNAPGSAYTPY